MNQELLMIPRVIAISLIVSTALGSVALAGKREREMMTKEVAPAVKDAEDKFKAGCGCALAITVDETTILSIEEMRSARNMANHVAEGAPKYCTDAASKKAVCQLKTLTLAKAATCAFTFKDGKGVLTTDGNLNGNWEQIVHVLDK
jgi:hypothetical protein